MSNTPKFNPVKLKAFLDSLGLEVEDVEKFCAPKSILDQLMDKYDLAQLDTCQNMSTHEFPVLAPKSYSFPSSSSTPTWSSNQPISYYQMPMMTPPQWAFAFGISGVTMGVDTANDGEAVVVESPLTKLKNKVASLQNATPVQIPDLTPQAPAKMPDYMHTLTAWRAWGCAGSWLMGLGYDTFWEPRKAQKSRCVKGTHDSPQFNCSCGFWSFKSLDMLTDHLSKYTGSTVVVGTVEIWGRVIECENGFRSEFAYPKELWLLEDGFEHLSHMYGVPVRKQ